MAPRRGSAALKRKIGERVRALRQDAGRTQESVAWSCGIAKALLSRIESGENLPSVPTLLLIARELGVHAADVLAYDMRDPRCRLLDAARRRDSEGVTDALRALGLGSLADDKASRDAHHVTRPRRVKRKPKARA